MKKQIETIQNVKEFFLLEHNIYVRNTDNKLFLHKEEKHIIDDDIELCTLYNGKIYYNKKNATNVLWIYDIRSGSKQHIDNVYLFSCNDSFGSNCIYLSNSDDIFMYDYELNLIKTAKIQGLPRLEISYGYYLFSRFGELFCFDMLSNKKKWSFQYEERISDSIYIHNNILSVPLSNEHLLGINADTGEKLWEIENALWQYSLNPQNGYLYGFAVERYEIINIANGDMVLQKKFENLEEKYNIFVPANMSKIYGNGLYFTSNCNNRNFGKINLNTNEIEYVQPLNFKMGVNAHIPIAQNGKIYILDDQNTLHIFEE